MGRVRDPGQVARVLDQHVLEAPSRADQGNSPLTGRAHDLEHRFGVSVWTPRPYYDRGPGISDQPAVYGVGRYDADLDVCRVELRSVLESSHSGGPVLLVGRQVDQNRDDR